MKQYTVTGMTCAACSARVEKAVLSVQGVDSCAVSLLTNSMGVEGTASTEAVIAAVTAAGYGAAEKGAETNVKENALPRKETASLLGRLGSSLVFLLMLMYVSMGHGMWGWPLPSVMAESPLVLGLTQLLLTAAVMVINQRFFVSGVRSTLKGAPNMDALVAMGSGAAFAYSTCVLFRMAAEPAHAAHYLHDLYFESAAMILTLITVGKWLESRSKGRTTDALQGLMDLAPVTATILRDGAEQIVPVEQVTVGTEFVVRPGESVPVDGVVLEGSSAVDESALTGESVPVDKASGDTVSAATINRSGFLRCRATRVGEDTTLSGIIRIVEQTAATKAPIAKAADRVAAVFVPFVIAVAAVTVLVWLVLNQPIGFALARGIAVLVISCPCALGLATPVAIMVGGGVGARRGVLFKTAAALEQTGRIKTVVLDKTGTVTEGRPQVTDIYPVDGDENALLRVAYALEHPSEHPLAAAVCRLAQERGLTPDTVADFKAQSGSGVTALLDDRRVAGGNLNGIRRYTAVSEAVEQKAAALAQEGKTPLFFAQGDRLLGILAVADTIKSDSADAVAALKQMGVRTVMLTGDTRATAQAIARQVGVDEVIAEVLPDGKEAAVRALQQQGAVAMVGDGINDAPALTRADVGIAIGAGTDVAMDAADVVLMHSRLSDVPYAIRLGRATLRNIYQNLFWAFAYNAVGIPLAAGVFSGWLGWELNPMFGAAAMSLSSFCVVTNALRLNFFKFPVKTRSKVTANSPISQTKKEVTCMEKTLKVEGMMCPRCEAHVKEALEGVPGVTAAVADRMTGTATITLAEDVTDTVLKAAVETQGYKVL